jgi:CheY-like chemotaxis protein
MGQGSTFTVHLPLTSAPATSELEPVVPNAPRPGDSRSILVVDDNIDAADTLAEMLRMYGHRVAVAYTPEAGLQTFTKHKLDLAILDIGLPGMNGYELADLMRTSGCNSEVRYVALSGFGQELDKERSASAGFTAHLVKPLAPGALGALANV